jgi:hypothetical protein
LFGVEGPALGVFKVVAGGKLESIEVESTLHEIMALCSCKIIIKV